MKPSQQHPIIIYGFEPWGSTPYNVSGELIKQSVLQEELTRIGVSLEHFRFEVLPVQVEALPEFVEENSLEPFGFIGIGSSASAKTVTVESWFANIFKGRRILGSVATGAMVPCNILPEHADLFAFGDTQSAGTFVCNASALYGFEMSQGQSAFIHVPKQEDSTNLEGLSKGVARAVAQMRFSSFGFTFENPVKALPQSSPSTKLNLIGPEPSVF